MSKHIYTAVVKIAIAIDSNDDVPGQIEDTISEAFTENLVLNGVIEDWMYWDEGIMNYALISDDKYSKLKEGDIFNLNVF